MPLCSDNKSELINAFLMNPILYETTPPVPTSHPKLYRIALDPNRHTSHKLTPAFLADSKPILTRCDVGLPLDELIVNYAEYENQEGELDPEDLMLVHEIVDKK